MSFALDTLRAEFCRRRAKNPNYSLRTFAKYLEMPPGRLSEIFSNKRNISKKMALRIAERLPLEPEEKAKFLGSINGSAKNIPEPSQEKLVSRTLSEDAFHTISDWYHFAILSLMKTSDFRDDSRWIASRLGISTVEVGLAMERLERLNLIRKTAKGSQRTESFIATSTDIPSAALKKAHAQSLERAIESLDILAVEERDFSSVTIACDPKKLNEAKQMIKKFRRNLAAFLEDGPKKEVFELNIQLMPITK